MSEALRWPTGPAPKSKAKGLGPSRGGRRGSLPPSSTGHRPLASAGQKDANSIERSSCSNVLQQHLAALSCNDVPSRRATSRSPAVRVGSVGKLGKKGLPGRCLQEENGQQAPGIRGKVALPEDAPRLKPHQIPHCLRGCQVQTDTGPSPKTPFIDSKGLTQR